MWLIEARERVLKHFADNDVPKYYAILSHTWGEDEVTFEDIQGLGSLVCSKKGYRKIEFACKQAMNHGLEFIWIDTCCIDKRSSAELSQAINSMYQWYEQAHVCYAFLSDVSTTDPEDLYKSRWFTRGWTLQEMLAPKNVHFYNDEWQYIGSKPDLHEMITQITGITLEVLKKSKPLSSISVAHRMSWMANRETSRIEDKAYCLLGIFDINMALLYGEGGKAFIRLQEEILRRSDDHSIFAWSIPGAGDALWYGLLATSPSAFANSANIESFRDWAHHSSPSIVGSGLSIKLALRFVAGHIFEARLNCKHAQCEQQPRLGRLLHPEPEYITISLLRIPGTFDQYVRIMASSLPRSRSERDLVYRHRQIYVQQSPTKPDRSDINLIKAFRLQVVQSPTHDLLSIPCAGMLYQKPYLAAQFASTSPAINDVLLQTKDLKRMYCALLFKRASAVGSEKESVQFVPGKGPYNYLILFGSGCEPGTIGWTWTQRPALMETNWFGRNRGASFTDLSRYYKPSNIVGFNHLKPVSVPEGIEIDIDCETSRKETAHIVSITVRESQPKS